MIKKWHKIKKKLFKKEYNLLKNESILSQINSLKGNIYLNDENIHKSTNQSDISNEKDENIHKSTNQSDENDENLLISTNQNDILKDEKIILALKKHSKKYHNLRVEFQNLTKRIDIRFINDNVRDKI